MLVLSRKRDEQIKIGDDITITLTRIKGGEVRLGIEAPKHVKILRVELGPLPAEPPLAKQGSIREFLASKKSSASGSEEKEPQRREGAETEPAGRSH